MEKMRRLLALICCAVMLLSTGVCMAEGTEEETDIAAGFASKLDYVSENVDTIECAVIIEALEGSFRENVAAEEITVKVLDIAAYDALVESGADEIDPEVEYADVSELAVVYGDGAELEVSFIIPKGELSADEFAIQGYVSLADGVVLDSAGNAVGAQAELTVWELDMTDRAGNSGEVYERIELTLVHKGAYVADFHVSWDELTRYDYKGNAIFERRSWDDNGKNQTAGFKTTIVMKDARNVSIMARGKTGLVWEKWRTSFNKQGLNFSKGKLTISGTTLNQKADYSFR